MNRDGIIKKLNEIFRQGYTPSRGKEEYSVDCIDNIPIARLANCFVHACFNLKNDHYWDYYITSREAKQMKCFYNESDDDELVQKKLITFVKRTGLLIKPCDQNLVVRENQWKVGLYFSNWSCLSDYHFLLQEKDGTWSGKRGLTKLVDRFEELPQQVYDYELKEIFVITNPYI